MKFFNFEKRDFTEDEAEILISRLPGFDGVRTDFTSAKAIENSDIFTIVNLLASDVASLDVKKKKDDVSVKDDLTSLLNIKPNSLYSGGTFKFIITANALLNGESFAEIVRDKKGPTALAHLANSNVTVKMNEETNHRLEYHVWTGKDKSGKNKVKILKPEDILHFKFFTLNGINGVSPLKSLKEDLSMQKDSKRFLSNFFRNDTQTGGILKMKHGKLSKEAREKVKKEWQESNAGVKKAHEVLVIDETFDYEPIQIDTEILKLINASTFSTETIGKTYRIPRHKLGLETSNMSLAQANLDYLTSTLNSYLKVITNELDFKLLKGDSESFEFDTAPFKTVDIETLTKITLEKLEKGVYSLNEARKELGDLPKSGDMYDKHYISLNFTSLELLEKYQLAKANGSIKGGDNE